MRKRLSNLRRPGRLGILVAAVAALAVTGGVALAASGSSKGERSLQVATNTSPPTVNGVLTVGSTLTANPGNWNGQPPFTFAYQWFSCDGVGANCFEIPAATQQTYALTALVQDRTLRVQVTAIDASGTPSLAATSDATVNTIREQGGLLEAPDNVAAPQIGGTTAQGSTLTAFTGQWNGDPAPFFTYLWSRCNAAGTACNPIAGATSSTYVLTAADVANTLRVQITASNSEGADSVDSAASSIVGVPLGPDNTALPAITGNLQVGQTLTASDGTWSGADPMTFTYQWQRCNSQGQACVAIPGATQQAYVLQSADNGDTLRVVVTATNADGNASATSNATGVVGGGTPSGGTIPVSQVSLPNRMIISGVDYTPNILTSRAPFTARFRVSDSEGHFVSGAQVLLLGIPFGRFQEEPQVVTDAQGWATFQIQPTAKMPLQKGFLITIFVRATKPGGGPDNEILGGVSTRRLSSIRINPNL